MRETRDELQNNELNKEAVQELLKRKDRLEKEVQDLRAGLKERYVDRSDVDRWKAAFEAKINSLKAEYSAAAEKQVNEKLAQYQTYLDRQVYINLFICVIFYPLLNNLIRFTDARSYSN